MEDRKKFFLPPLLVKSERAEKLNDVSQRLTFSIQADVYHYSQCHNRLSDNPNVHTI